MPSIKELIENMPATLTELANKSGVSYRSVMRIRDGEKVNRSTANKILHGLSQLYGQNYTLNNVTDIHLSE